MALTFALQKIDQDNNTKIVNAVLYSTLTSITLDNSYATGGIPLTATQLGFTSGGNVYFGVVSLRTTVAVGPSGGVLDCTNPGQPKLKLQAAANAAELGVGVGTGAIVDVLAIGF